MARPGGEAVLWPAEECRVSERRRSGTNQSTGEREREIEREKGRFGWKEKTERQLEKEAFR